MKAIAFCKKHAVLLIAAIAAILSMFWVPPNVEYLDYLDVPVLILLFCLMAVVAGLRKLGVFQQIAGICCKHVKTARKLAFLMLHLCFFLSMLVTNDVALITLVPLTCSIFEQTNQQKSLMRIVVIEAAAANLGSMATPIGNPQNLYLYHYYHFSAGTFFQTILPIVLVSYILLLFSLLLVPNLPLQTASLPDTSAFSFLSTQKKPLILYLLLAVFCLVTVGGWVTHSVCLCVVLLGVLLTDRKLLLCVDWELLLTFVCFFLFSGNLQNIETMRHAMTYFLSGNVCLTSAIVSQVISNVPAAVLLSGFTEQGRALLLGVNIGGLGTPIASLASLIAYQYYAKSKLARNGQYMLFFLGYQFIGLFLLLAVQNLLFH